MARAALRHIAFGLATSGLLMGCVQGAGSGSGAAAGASPGATRAAAAGDVEAPEVFQATDSALWDGRPSLGGIWVAAPDVKDPERVVMFNPATGKTVQGALFRRERDNPGPRLQISSDAAAALGILAGQPVEIQVTALRRVEPTAAPGVVPPSAEGEAVAAAAEGTVAPAAGDDAAATAAAATAALATTGAAAVDAALPGGDAAAAEAPKRKTWKERRAEARAAREAKKAAAAAAAAGALPGATAIDEVPATGQAVSVEAVEVTAIDAPPADAASAEPPAQPAAEAAAATPAPTAGATGRLIQVASFGKEANATRAVEALAKAGVTSQARKSETNGKVVWGVVTTGDEAQLTALKGLGFADAYFLQ